MRTIGTVIALAATIGVADANADELKEYGEYLAGECTTCHRLDGKDSGIPSIVGWKSDSFVAVLNSYKSGERENAAMQSVAQALDEEQIKALAAYFASLTVKE